jgi:FkbM family methyltransferase
VSPAVYAGSNRMLMALPNGHHLVLIADDLSLTPDLVTHGMYDWPFWHFLHRYLRPGDHAADIGANIGLFTVGMAAIVGSAGRVTAYEADPEVADVLTDNVTSNWFADWVDVVPVAAGSTAGTVTLRRHPRFRGSSAAGVADVSQHAVGQGYTTVDVPLERPDGRLDGARPLRLVKVDVEGGEADVVRGLSGLLDRNAIELLDLEVVPDNAASADDLRDVVTELMDKRGARPNRIDDRGRLQPLTPAQVLDGSRHPHVVFDLRATPARAG